MVFVRQCQWRLTAWPNSQPKRANAGRFDRLASLAQEIVASSAAYGGALAVGPSLSVGGGGVGKGNLARSGTREASISPPGGMRRVL